MFRELRRSREDPEVLAAQAQEQYDKVFNGIACSCLLFDRSQVNLRVNI